MVNKMIKTLSNVHYHMDMGCGIDVWRIVGDDEEGRTKSISTPVKMDEKNDILTTASGSVYHITNYSGSREMFIAQVVKDIANGGYEVR
jgi:hypothetical protein